MGWKSRNIGFAVSSALASILTGSFGASLTITALVVELPDYFYAKSAQDTAKKKLLTIWETIEQEHRDELDKTKSQPAPLTEETKSPPFDTTTSLSPTPEQMADPAYQNEFAYTTDPESE